MSSVYNTKKALEPQGAASRLANVTHDILNQLQMRLEIKIACGCRVCDPAGNFGFKPLNVTLAELGLTGTGAGTLAQILIARFPFITPRTAEDIAVSSRTLRDAVDSVLVKVGPLHDSTPERSPAPVASEAQLPLLPAEDRQ